MEHVLLNLVVEESGCITWPSKKTQAGYGVVGLNRKKHYVHRLLYEYFRGPIPAGLELDHLCRNRACANPWHLEAVTHRENTIRGEGASGKNARRTHCKRGHPLFGDNLLPVKKGTRLCKICRQASRKRLREKAKLRKAAVGSGDPNSSMS